MHLKINLNSKHDTSQITAFLDQLSCYEHQIDLVFGPDDLINPDPMGIREITLDDLPIQKHHLKFINRVVYQKGVDEFVTEFELYVRPVNKIGIRRKE